MSDGTKDVLSGLGISVKDYAEATQSHPNTIYLAIKAGQIPVVESLGRKKLIPVSWVRQTWGLDQAARLSGKAA